MKLVSRLAIAAALAAAPAIASAAVSPAVGKALNAAQKGNVAALAQARAAANTPEEKRAVAQMSAYVYTKSGQYGKAAAELEAMGAPPSQLAPLYYQAGQLDKAIAAGKRMGGAQGLTIVGQSYIRQGKFAPALAIYQQLVKQNPGNQRYLENLAGAQYKTGNKEAYLATTTRLIKVDPSPARWNALLSDLKNEQMSREAKLALYHLMDQTGNLNNPADFQEFAKLAIVNNQPGAAKAALDKAKARNAISGGDQMTMHLLEAANGRAAEANTMLAKLPGTPAGRFQAGNILLGAGNYPAAIGAYNTAIGGRVNPDQATVFKGIAQVRSGQAAAARATFKSVPAGPMTDIANMWSLYASTKG